MRSPDSGGTLNPLRIRVQKMSETGGPNPAPVRGVTVMLYLLDSSRPRRSKKVSVAVIVRGDSSAPVLVTSLVRVTCRGR